MTRRVSRRGVLQGASALAAVAACRTFMRVLDVAAQAGTPQAALEQLFSAVQADPSWFSPTVLQKVPIAQLQAEIDGLKGLFGAYQLAAEVRLAAVIGRSA